jgi:hypothetical protein
MTLIGEARQKKSLPRMRNPRIEKACPTNGWIGIRDGVTAVSISAIFGKAGNFGN